MEISGKIIVALPPQGGVSKSGNEWSRQDYVIETNDKYPKKIAFSVMNDNIMNFGLTVGQNVDIQIDINASEWKGRWFNSITCWKATLRNPGQPTSTSQPAPAHAQHNQQPQAPVLFGDDDKDDLPF